MKKFLLGVAVLLVNFASFRSVRGFGIFAFQITLYPFVEGLLGPVMIARIGGIITIPLL
ncbi:protein ZINC INDUCED FACILITATOR-LIKE 1-like [Prunus yedoensis var. nudiflora]|uniref:Protein ZINC INDUCED FACILITATOR-LIKE 1-like n=1 Tax=Prunus yedoensis var. nudiflora TaxID=2094558 RepID=A0A314XNI3_PRUYE|nr:protein ZINC INDUCED FACILITATOR-LIKE 1-like [Prunus yedoensis var. nudiflora]